MSSFDARIQSFSRPSFFNNDTPTPYKKRKTILALRDYFTEDEIGDEVKHVCWAPLCTKNYSINCFTWTLQHLSTHGFCSDESSQNKFPSKDKPGGLIQSPFLVRNCKQMLHLPYVFGCCMPIFHSRNSRIQKFKKFISVLSDNFKCLDERSSLFAFKKQTKIFQLQVDPHLNKSS